MEQQDPVATQLRSRVLYLLFTPDLCMSDPWETLRAALDGGVDLVQWRVPTLDTVGLERCLVTCGGFDVPVVVNNHVEQALTHDVLGAHVGQDDMPASAARAILGSSRCLGVSTHDPAQVRAAESAGADHLGFGPVFQSRTKGYPSGLGASALADALRSTSLPVFAIGGIDTRNLDELVAVGCHRIAVSGAILSAPRPGRAAAVLRQALDARRQDA